MFLENDPSQTVATARIAPKFCQGQRRNLAHIILGFIQIRFTFGGVIDERVKTVFAP